MAKISFTKMQGLGNDFVVLENLNHQLRLEPKQIRFLADRHRGVGCDQVLVIEKPRRDNCDFFYRIFNADGSEVGQCGNGARCLAKYVRDKKLISGNQIIVETITSLMTLKILDNHQIQVSMGIPKDIRLVQEQEYGHLGISLSLGNPHLVFQVGYIELADVEKLGQFFNHHQLFPEGVNVGFMQILDKNHIKLRVFERGVGETQACGSGACAAVVAGIYQHLLDKEVKVSLPGGDLQINWLNENSQVLMTGPAASVFEGHIFLPD